MALPLTNTPEERAALAMAWRMGLRLQGRWRYGDMWFYVRPHGSELMKELNFRSYVYRIACDDVTQS